MTQQEGNINFNKNGLTEEQEQIARDGQNFEPSEKVKKLFLSRRKRTRDWGTIKYPGLFDRYQAHDNEWFWFTVVMEIFSSIAAGVLLCEGENGLDGYWVVISVVVVFVLDFFFAYLHHLYKGIESTIENQKLLFLPEMRNGTAATLPYNDYYHSLNELLNSNINRKVIRHLASICIGVLACIKIYFFVGSVFTSYMFETAVEESKAPYLVVVMILVFYIWIFFNHLKFTGYCMAAFFCNKDYKDEKKKHNLGTLKENNKNQETSKKGDYEIVNITEFLDLVLREKDNPKLNYFTQKSHNYFQDDLKKGLVEIRLSTGHSIKEHEEKEGSYVFTRKGFLTDDQVNEMVRVQKTKLAQLAVAMYFHKFQMESAGLNVVDAEGSK